MLEKSVKTVRPLRSRPSAVAAIESLETRQLLSVSVNSAGFTTVTPAPGARVVYVSSSSGSDRNSGLSPSSPVATIVKGYSLLRNRTGDELLLKAGDTWKASFGVWSFSGASTSTPMVIGSYGTGARPTIDSGSVAGFLTLKTPVNYLDILGIHFDSNTRDPALVGAGNVDTHHSPTGLDFQGSSTGIVVENCKVENYAINVNIQNVWGSPSNFTFRNNVIINAWAIHGHAEGLYSLGVKGLTLTGNTFDHNGWSASIPYAGRNIYNHDCYLSADNSGVVVTNNIFSNAACTGLQDRPGGIVQNNYFVDDPVGAMFGLTNGAHTTVGGVTGSVTGNVFMGGANIGALTQGIGLEVGNIRAGAGAVVSNNVFSTGIANSGAAIMLSYGNGQPDPQDSVGINDLTVSNNTIYNWKTGIDIENGQKAGGKGITAFNRVNILNNKFEDIPGLSVKIASSLFSQAHFSGNVYYKANTWYVDFRHAAPHGTVLNSPIPFVDPSRSGATYDKSIGRAGSITDLLTAIETQAPTAHNPQFEAQALTSYIRAGFVVK